MNNLMQNNILVIGGPNAGKTHFGAQLYDRLNSRLFNYKIDPNQRPDDLTIFKEALDKLYEGKRAGHTEMSANRNIELNILDVDGNKITFSFLDYAGEQINKIITYRKIDDVWEHYIKNSSSWMLFIRLDEINPIEDIINKGIPSPEEILKRNATAPPIKISEAAHYVELLQMLLYTKGRPTLNKVDKPKLTIVLSCWDLLNLTEKDKPIEILKKNLPLLYYFIKNTWSTTAYDVVGLSSTERSLTDEPDEEFIEKLPSSFGYFIKPTGQKNKDLTLLVDIIE